MGWKIYINDKLIDESEAKVSVFDHGLLYGDGVFEGIRVYNDKIFELEAHMKRLYESAHAIRLEIPQDIDELSKNVEMTVKANDITDGYIRLVITRGVGNLGINPMLCNEPQIIIIAASIQLYPKELYEKGLKVVSACTMRVPPLSLMTQVKSLNYLNNILAKMEALDYGAMEAIMYNNQGFVAEASADNVFVIRNQKLITPPISSGALGGITRGIIMKLARENGYEVAEENITRYDMYTVDEIFLTGTGAELIGVIEVDGRKIGNGEPGPITKKLKKTFEEYVRS